MEVKYMLRALCAANVVTLAFAPRIVFLLIACVLATAVVYWETAR